MKDVTECLLPDKSKIDELQVFLGTRGGSSQKQPNIIEYEDGRLVVEYDKKGQIKAIRTVDDYSDSMLEHLRSELKNAFSDQGREVDSRYLHSLSSVQGFYRHANDFQLIPAPHDAPQPTFAYAQHSFRLEYSYSKSPNEPVNLYRAGRRYSELSLVLNALIRYLQVPLQFLSYEWVLSGKKDGRTTSQYLQLGYRGGHTEEPKDEYGFTTTRDIDPLGVVDSQKYYSQLGVEAGKPLQLPDSFTQSINAYQKLCQEQRKLFCRSSHWKHVSSRIWPVSSSAAFAALVTAIEVFLPERLERCLKCQRPISRDRCSECNQPIAGPTKLFREFVERHAPGVPAATRSKLYSVRSSLSHGSRLIPGELGELGFGQSPAANEARREHDLLSEIVQVCLINWLHSG